MSHFSTNNWTRFPNKTYPLHFLFNMATGSGKTLIMAEPILYLYEQGYRKRRHNYLFVVILKDLVPFPLIFGLG